MEIKQLEKILDLHQKWLNGEVGGERANLEGAYLKNAYLYGANLKRADLRSANLEGANLKRANLEGAYLEGANLKRADLERANLEGAYLEEAYLERTILYRTNLEGTNLEGTYLEGAYLKEANLNKAFLIGAKNIPFLPQCEICPSDGAFIGWKKVNSYIIKLQILEDSKRSSATTRKCRCDKALILEIQNIDGSASGLNSIINNEYAPCNYEVGKIVYPDSFDENRWNECSNGIHFFITRQEAVNW